VSVGEGIRQAVANFGGDYGGCRRDCLSPNYNCPSATDDATIALSVRTLCVASEGDTSLQSSRATGKSAGLPGYFIHFARLEHQPIPQLLPFVVFSKSSTPIGGFVPSKIDFVHKGILN
jgi:hypothetical protein